MVMFPVGSCVILKNMKGRMIVIMMSMSDDCPESASESSWATSDESSSHSCHVLNRRCISPDDDVKQQVDDKTCTNYSKFYNNIVIDHSSLNSQLCSSKRYQESSCIICETYVILPSFILFIFYYYGIFITILTIMLFMSELVCHPSLSGVSGRNFYWECLERGRRFLNRSP